MRVKVEVVLRPGPKKVSGPVRALVKSVLFAQHTGGSVTVAFVDEAEMTALNTRFRGLNSSTDVLSFGQADGEVDWPEPGGLKLKDLGEVVVCPAVVGRYAQEPGGDPETQLGWTVLHGVLHLLGYDHENDGGEMRALEQSLLGALDRQVRAVCKAYGG